MTQCRGRGVEEEVAGDADPLDSDQATCKNNDALPILARRYCTHGSFDVTEVEATEILSCT